MGLVYLSLEPIPPVAAESSPHTLKVFPMRHLLALFMMLCTGATLAAGIPDPVGTFYRYGLAKSLLRRKVSL